MSEIKVPSFEELVKTELTKFDSVVPAIEELKAELLPLVIKDLEDTEGYKVVSEALRFVVKKRTSIEDKRKELKADSLAYGKAVDARAREITQMLSPIEEHLREQKDKVDAELLRLEDVKEQEKQRLLQDKHNKLINTGMQLIGNQYINQKYSEHSSFPAINIETLSDEDFNSHIAILTNLYNLEEFKRIGEEKRLAEEKFMLEQDQIALQQERRMLMQEILETRLSLLVSLGCETSNISDFVFYKKQAICTETRLLNLTKEEWLRLQETIRQRIVEIDDQLQADIQAEKDLVAAAEEAEVKAKLQMIAKMIEKEKIAYFATQLLKVERPEMTTQKWGNELKKMITFISSYVESDAN